jgi:hypothetical protein
MFQTWSEDECGQSTRVKRWAPDDPPEAPVHGVAPFSPGMKSEFLSKAQCECFLILKSLGTA